MPDHLHLFVRLTGTLAISRCVARLKSKTNPVLHAKDMSWQGNFHEHRLRPDDPVESVIRYLHLNPYREKLVSTTEVWPWFWLGNEEAAWFVPLLDNENPFPEWLK
jgi:REP element-mobilizing transposase RayT